MYKEIKFYRIIQLMNQLTNKAFHNAKSFIYNHGRKLDKRRYEFHFENGSADSVLEVLATYQNEDGGFGHSLEPDLRTTVSSAIATTGAFQIFKEIGVNTEDTIVKRGIEYLLNTYDEQEKVWDIIPPEVEDAPHAPWWTYEGNRECFGKYLINPRVEIVGYLHDYGGDLVSKDWLESLTSDVMEHLFSLQDDLEMHDLLCCARLTETDNLPDVEKLWKKIEVSADKVIAKSPDVLNDYVLKPIWLVTKPSSLLTKVLRQEIDMNLDFEIEQQGEDGSWSPNFSWGELHPDVWEIAKKEWQSKLTIDTLKTLHEFGRIEG